MVEYIEGSTPMPDLTGMEGRCISCGLLAKTPGTARIANQNLPMYEVTAEERILKHPNASFHPGLGDRKSIGQCFAGIPFKTHMRQLADKPGMVNLSNHATSRPSTSSGW